jgi:hypothetical protein
MNLVLHLLFFLVLSLAIVVMSAFYSEPEDGPALASVPRRTLVFVGACAGVAAVMLVLEALFV